ncbi:MAG TPA: site-specific DNA-methyltransferase [Candidatus Saccharimonadales bacterium]|nr:site-specific DNA-methyltransferase [Candidatus Saccharimonadales bacterium]
MTDKSTNQSNDKIVTMSGLDIKDEVRRLKEIFPQFVKDGEVDFNAIKTWLSDNGSLASAEEKYGLGWAGKTEAIQAIKRKATATLKPDKEQSKDWDITQNLFIEGDNLETLKLLLRHYGGKVKMIYIDPPYNTGKDFVYKDSFQEGISDFKLRTGQNKEGSNYSTNSNTSGRYHSNWLSMMYPRLFYAKQLLNDNGVIFVSIDDNEVHNLREVMDEVFGAENFVCQLIWEKVHTRKNSAQYFSYNHDYILCFARSKSDWRRNLIPREDRSAYSNPDNDPKGDWKADPITAHNEYSANYKIQKPNGTILERPAGRYWAYSEESWNAKVSANAVIWGDGDSYPMVKRYLAEVQDGLVPQTIFDRKFAGDSARAKKDIDELNLSKGLLFDYPKPVLLIKRLLQIGTTVADDDIVLDFFAGSGTTAHAVMEQNADDGGNRKWICVQLAEETALHSEARKQGFTTISQIARERIKRAGDRLTKDYHQEVKDRKTRLDTGFKAFKLAASNYRHWQPIEADAENLRQLMLEQAQQSLEHPLVEKYEVMDVIYEVLLKEGMDLNSSVEEKNLNGSVFYEITDGERRAVLTLAEKIDIELTENLGLGHDDLFVCLDSSLTDSTKANLAQSIKLKTI